MVEAVKQNFPQREIADASYELQGEIDHGRRIVVGVNRYTEGDDDQHPILHIDPALERKQVGRVQAVRARRDAGKVSAALGVLKQHASTRRQPHAASPRLRSCSCNRGRDRGGVAGGLRQLHRDARLLVQHHPPRRNSHEEGPGRHGRHRNRCDRGHPRLRRHQDREGRRQLLRPRRRPPDRHDQQGLDPQVRLARSRARTTSSRRRAPAAGSTPASRPRAPSATGSRVAAPTRSTARSMACRTWA